MTQTETLPLFLTPHERVPHLLRELLLEADGCLMNGFLTGGTACAERAVQALFAHEKIDGSTHQARVLALAEKHQVIPQLFIKILLQFGDSSPREGARLTATGLGLLVVTLKALTYEIYVAGHERSERLQYVLRLMESERIAPTPAGAASAV